VAPSSSAAHGVGYCFGLQSLMPQVMTCVHTRSADFGTGITGPVMPVPKSAERLCTQVITCGIKDGKPKQYPTQCAAEDDGATNLKIGQACPAKQ